MDVDIVDDNVDDDVDDDVDDGDESGLNGLSLTSRSLWNGLPESEVSRDHLSRLFSLPYRAILSASSEVYWKNKKRVNNVDEEGEGKSRKGYETERK